MSIEILLQLYRLCAKFTLSLKFRSMKKVVRLCPGGSNQYPERIFDFLKSFLNFGFCGFDFIEMLTMELSGVDF